MVAGFCPLGYGVEALCPSDEATHSNGEVGQSVVTDGPGHASLRDGQKGFVEEIGIIFREFHGDEPRGEWWLEAWIGQLPRSVFVKRSDKD